MADRYVKIGGSNLLDGTSLANAWETYTFGFANVGTSNTLKISGLSGGVYSEARSTVYTVLNNGVSGNHTIITDNGDGAVTLRRASGWSGIVNFSQPGTAHKYITFQGTAANQLIFDGQSAAGMANIYLGNISEGNTDISLINCEIKDSATSGVLGASCPNVIIRGCNVHGNGTSTSQDHGVYLGGNLNALVEDSTFYDNSANGFRHGGAASSGLILRNSKAWNNGGAGTDGNGFIIYDSANAQVYNLLAYQNANAGIHIGRGGGATVYHNSCHENRVGILLGGFNSPSNTIIKNNLLLDNTDDDIHITSLASNTTYAWNRCSAAGITDVGISSTNGGNNVTTGVDTTEWVDPDNVTLASRDYNLKAGAASIAPSGIVSVGVSEDIDGDARNFIDQGAYAYGSTTPPDPPIIVHPGSEVVTREFTDVSLTLTKGTNNIVTCTISGTGTSAISATPTNVTVVRN